MLKALDGSTLPLDCGEHGIILELVTSEHGTGAGSDITTAHANAFSRHRNLHGHRHRFVCTLLRLGFKHPNQGPAIIPPESKSGG